MVHVQGTVEVDVDHLLPQRDVGIQEHPDLVPTGIVDQDVDGAALLGLGHGAIDGGTVGDVDRVPGGLATGIADHARGFLGAGGVEVENVDLGAFLAETLADLPPDSAAAARHDGALALQTSHDRCSSCLARAGLSHWPRTRQNLTDV